MFLVKDSLHVLNQELEDIVLIKPKCETSFRLRRFSQRVVTDWNNLPYNIVTAQTLTFWSREDMYIFKDENFVNKKGDLSPYMLRGSSNKF